jgi:hypothetical protein
MGHHTARVSSGLHLHLGEHTLDTDAVKTTTSYSSPTRFMNWSTPGRLITYTLWYCPSISTGMVKSAWCSIYTLSVTKLGANNGVANLEAAVHEGLVQVQYQALLSLETRRYWAEQILLLL